MNKIIKITISQFINFCILSLATGIFVSYLVTDNIRKERKHRVEFTPEIIEQNGNKYSQFSYSLNKDYRINIIDYTQSFDYIDIFHKEFDFSKEIDSTFKFEGIEIINIIMK